MIAGRIFSDGWPPAVVGATVLAVSSFAQAANGITESSDVSFSAAEIALIGVIFSPIAAAVTLLFKSLLSSKDETIKIQQLTIAAMQLRLNDAVLREVALQDRLVGAFADELRDNHDVLQEVVTSVKELDGAQDRRHNEFVKLMTAGDRRSSEQKPNPGRRSSDV